MNIKILLIISVFIYLSIYSAANIEKNPNDEYIIQNHHKYELKEIMLRAEILDLETNNDEYLIKGRTGNITYNILIKDNLPALIPQTGDYIDFRGVSHLDEGYLVANQTHVRTNMEHRLLFIRSLLAIPIVLLALWRERDQLFGGS